MLRLQIAGAREILVYPEEDLAPAVFTILKFPVDDIDEAVDGLVERGVEIVVD